MTVKLDQFVEHLTQSGLLSAAEITSFQDALPPDKRPKDGEALARELVRANKITKYQAQVVYQGKPKGLVFGDYRVLDKLGQGGMGVVLKAEHRRMKRMVAVKVILGHPTAVLLRTRAGELYGRSPQEKTGPFPADESPGLPTRPSSSV